MIPRVVEGENLHLQAAHDIAKDDTHPHSSHERSNFQADYEEAATTSKNGYQTRNDVFEPYVHEPIDGTKEIRLVLISKEDDATKMLCGMSATLSSDDELPSFIHLINDRAFSHARWVDMSLNSKCFLLTRGLDLCLRRLREQSSDDITVFAPALCLTPAEAAAHQDSPSGLMARATHTVDAMDVIAGLSDAELVTLNVRKLVGPEDATITKHAATHTRRHLRRALRREDSLFSHKLYRHLDRAVHEFRLLSVTSYKGIAHFSLRSISMEQLGPETVYFALSYAWGDEAELKTIVVDGIELSVRRNLYDFLMERAEAYIALNADEDASHEANFWIDAICINQDDQAEKMIQVKMMSEIYTKAECVLVWLGHISAPCKALLESLATDAAQDLVQRGNSIITRKQIETEPETFAAFAEIFLRAYFFRAWTTQELALGREVVIAAGSTRVRWSTLANYSTHHTDLEAFAGIVVKLNAEREDKLRFLTGTSLARMSLIERIQHRKKADKPITLLSLLLATLQLRTTIAKDKLYSLWSLADDAAELLPSPDYRQSDGQVFEDFAKAWILKHGRLDILSIRSIPRDRWTDTCPRWAVDWSDEARLTRPFLSAYPTALRDDVLDDVETSRLYAADKGTDMLVAFAREDYRVSLITAGISCDTVEVIGENVDSWTKPLNSWVDLVNALPSGHPGYKDYHSAIIAGRNPMGQRVEPINTDAMYGDDVGLENELAFMLWRRHVHSVIIGRQLAITKGGHVGLVPRWTEPGDEIVIMFGCSVPLVTRPLSSGARIIIGDCFMRRMMDGQMVEAAGGVKTCMDVVWPAETTGQSDEQHTPSEDAPEVQSSLGVNGNISDVVTPPGQSAQSDDRSQIRPRSAHASDMKHRWLQATKRTRLPGDDVYVQPYYLAG